MARNLKGWVVPIQSCCEGHAKDMCSTIARARRRWPAKEIKFHAIGNVKPHCVAKLIEEGSVAQWLHARPLESGCLCSNRSSATYRLCDLGEVISPPCASRNLITLYRGVCPFERWRR